MPSPGTARVDRAEKLPLYARHGVRHAWLIDPDIRVPEAYQNHDGRWPLLTTLEQDAAVAREALIDSRFPFGAGRPQRKTTAKPLFCGAGTGRVPGPGERIYSMAGISQHLPSALFDAVTFSLAALWAD